MRKWGILVTALYSIVVIVLVVPIIASYSGNDSIEWLVGWRFLIEEREAGELWVLGVIWIGILVAAQAILLFVSVDTSFRRLHARRHIMVSVATVGLAVALLSTTAIWSVIVAITGDDWPGGDPGFVYAFLWVVMFSWVGWAIVFHHYKSDVPDKVNLMTRWLVRGSVLELLIVVPCHIIVRSRGDCSAPMVTGYGIATGIAVMLLAFGPAVLFLYQKRLAQYGHKQLSD